MRSKPLGGLPRKEPAYSKRESALRCRTVSAVQVGVEIFGEQFQGGEQRRSRHIDQAAVALAFVEIEQSRNLIERRRRAWSERGRAQDSHVHPKRHKDMGYRRY